MNSSSDVQMLIVGLIFGLIADELGRWKCFGDETPSIDLDSPNQPLPGTVRVRTHNLLALTEFVEVCAQRLAPQPNEEIVQLAKEMVKFFKGEEHTWTVPMMRPTDLGVSGDFEVSDRSLEWLRDEIDHFAKRVRLPQPSRITTTLPGPLSERDSAAFQSVDGKIGAHYNIYQIHGGVRTLRSYFPDGEASPWNFILFSTSGMHGTYTTLEDIAAGLRKYGDHPAFSRDESTWPTDWNGNRLTVLIVQPRLVCVRFGVVEVTLEDVSFLERLRETSYEASARIGRADWREWVRSVLGDVRSMYLPPPPTRPSDN